MKRLFQRKHKGMTAMELAVVCIVIVLISAGAAWGFSHLTESGKRAVANSEAASLAKACALYESDNRAAAPPTDLGALITGLTAAQANDGVAKTRYVSKDTWTATAASITDPWGNAYTYSSTNRTVTSTNNGNTAIVKRF